MAKKRERVSCACGSHYSRFCSGKNNESPRDGKSHASSILTAFLDGLLFSIYAIVRPYIRISKWFFADWLAHFLNAISPRLVGRLQAKVLFPLFPRKMRKHGRLQPFCQTSLKTSQFFTPSIAMVKQLLLLLMLTDELASMSVRGIWLPKGQWSGKREREKKKTI